MTPTRRPTVRPLTTALVTLFALSACSGAVDVDPVSVDAGERATCEALVADLPDELFGQPVRAVSPDDALAKAWGDPAVVLECGVGPSEEYDAFSRCSEIEGIGWFIPSEQLGDLTKDVTMTVESHQPRVRLTVPAQWRQDGPDTALTRLAEPLGEHLTEFNPCR